MTEFDEAKHEYRIDGVIVPSTTQIIRGVLGGFESDDWYLQRGTAVHACAALIARGVEFEHDPAIDGYVAAVRKWFELMKPDVTSVETVVCNERYRYAGRMDMLCEMKQFLVPVIVDWKNSGDISRTQLQLSAYAQGKKYNGMEVELHDDGTYSCTLIQRLDKMFPSFLNVLSTYNYMRNNNIKERNSRNE